MDCNILFMRKCRKCKRGYNTVTCPYCGYVDKELIKWGGKNEQRE
jgi:RNA polymerase subunit RPABC4/transcription elongation factor Spt4